VAHHAAWPSIAAALHHCRFGQRVGAADQLAVELHLDLDVLAGMEIGHRVGTSIRSAESARELHAPSKKVAVHDPAVFLAGCCAKRTDAWSHAGQRAGKKQLVRHSEIRCPIDLDALRG